jgi:chaperone modulatory protein CbpM
VRFYTRDELLELASIDAGFLVALESEEIVLCDAPEQGHFSERMLERARVAHELVAELDVNLAGAAIILRMREEIAGLRRDLQAVAVELRRLRGSRTP